MRRGGSSAFACFPIAVSLPAQSSPKRLWGVERIRKGTASHGGGLGTKAVALALALMAAGPLGAAGTEPRTVKVRLAADRGIANQTEWRIAAARLLDGCFKSFAERFGIRLVLEDVVGWMPETGRRPLAGLLGELRRKVQRGRSDIVLGVTAPERTADVNLGIASYPHAYVLVKNLASREAMVYALLHEFCHIFGAADLRERGSLMGIESPGFAVDAFTAEAVLLNRDRRFGPGVFPLPAEALDGTISHYDRRAGRGLREPHVHLLLTLLYIEKNDLEAAARACAAAAAADPGVPGLRNLMGNICLFRGDDDAAVAEYRKALELQPREEGIHFNLGLACARKGMLKEAAAEFRAALKIHPRYSEAAQALKAVELAGPDVEAARRATESFILGVRKAR